MKPRPVLLAIAVVWGCVGLWALQAAQSTGVKKRVPPFYKSAEAAKPYPKTVPPEKYSHPVLQKVYKTAKDIPGVLAQQPCYCYCDAHGHKSLLHCHRDDHSAGWMVCIKEVLLAERLHKAGKTPAQIREAIIRGDWELENPK